MKPLANRIAIRVIEALKLEQTEELERRLAAIIAGELMAEKLLASREKRSTDQPNQRLITHLNSLVKRWRETSPGISDEWDTAFKMAAQELADALAIYPPDEPSPQRNVLNQRDNR